VKDFHRVFCGGIDRVRNAPAVRSSSSPAAVHLRLPRRLFFETLLPGKLNWLRDCHFLSSSSISCPGMRHCQPLLSRPCSAIRNVM